MKMPRHAVSRKSQQGEPSTPPEAAVIATDMQALANMLQLTQLHQRQERQ